MRAVRSGRRRIRVQLTGGGAGRWRAKVWEATAGETTEEILKALRSAGIDVPQTAYEKALQRALGQGFDGGSEEKGGWKSRNKGGFQT